MNRREYLINCLAEECSEAAVAAAKCNRFTTEEVMPGQPLTNAERLISELKDVISVAQILINEGIIPAFNVEPEDIARKLAKIEKYMKISVECGALSVELEETFL